MRSWKSIFNTADPILRAVDICVDYQRKEQQQVVLSAFTDQIRAGELMALAGRSGSGKTSLLRVLYGLQEPSAGTVWWGDRELRGLPEKHRQAIRRECFGYASQDVLLLEEETLETNVRAAGASVEAARKFLGELGLGEWTQARSKGFSGGERQRVAVARALAKEPVVALLDEPTASLDAAAAELVRDLLLASAEQGVAVVVASHDEVILDAADRVVQL